MRSAAACRARAETARALTIAARATRPTRAVCATMRDSDTAQPPEPLLPGPDAAVADAAATVALAEQQLRQLDASSTQQELELAVARADLADARVVAPTRARRFSRTDHAVLISRGATGGMRCGRERAQYRPRGADRRAGGRTERRDRCRCGGATRSRTPRWFAARVAHRCAPSTPPCPSSSII